MDKFVSPTSSIDIQRRKEEAMRRQRRQGFLFAYRQRAGANYGYLSF
jgi:hypothetical protein